MILQRVVLLVVAQAALSLAPAAHAQVPRPDVTFGGGGVTTMPWVTSNLDREVAALAPDGGVFIANESDQDLRIVRLDERGVPIPSYVGGGIARVTITEPLHLSAIAVEPDGALLLGGRRDVVRIDATGRLDLAFGNAGRTRIPYLTDGVCATARVLKILPHAAGWLVVGRDRYTDTSVAPPVERSCSYIARIGRDGTPDLTFGINGNLTRSRFVAFDAVLRDQYIEVIGRLTGQNGARVERVDLNGRMLESFGSFGTLQLPGETQTRFIADGRILPDASLVVLESPDLSNLVWYRYRADHKPDPRFTGIGRAVVPLRDQDRSQFDIWQSRVLPLADGGFIARVNVFTASNSVWASDFYKIDERGFPDRTFGDGGYTRVRAGGHSRVTSWVAQPDGYLVISGASFSTLPTSSVLPPVPGYVTVTAFATRFQAVPDIVEFYNTITRHYFIAYDGPEAQGIDSGAAGNGWNRTGLGFRPGGSSPECRFYTAGANSHFFTAEPGECEEVKRSPGWIYEGLGFYATRITNGGCASPLIPVYRFYNNRARFNDSNHRFVTDLSVRPAMEAQGWLLEGIVFCAKP